jgi:hypothetical protein
VEPMTNNVITEDVNQLYITTMHEENYINPTKYGMLSWRSISFFSLDFDTILENWQQ